MYMFLMPASGNSGPWNRIYIFFSLVLCHTHHQNSASISRGLITMLENREIWGRNYSICLYSCQFKISLHGTGFWSALFVFVFTDPDKEPVAIGKWSLFPCYIKHKLVGVFLFNLVLLFHIYSKPWYLYSLLFSIKTVLFPLYWRRFADVWQC